MENRGSDSFCRPKGIGTDIIEIKRIEKAMAKEGFLEKVFNPEEIEYIKDNPLRCAGLFCAKEAVAKATGLGLSKTGIKNIHISHTKEGAPTATVDGTEYVFHLSISHSENYATATAICLLKD
ncbi:MAG: holo-ACP synthase [Clostridia bacterium]|nr:holo-ACP synthase [Clostridia bacterium]